MTSSLQIVPDVEEENLTKDKQMTSKSTEGKEMQTKTGTERGNMVEGAIMVPAGKEEAGWSRELEFETHSMKGGLLSHRTCLLFLTKFNFTFCSLYFERESQKMPLHTSEVKVYIHACPDIL